MEVPNVGITSAGGGEQLSQAKLEKALTNAVYGKGNVSKTLSMVLKDENTSVSVKDGIVTFSNGKDEPRSVKLSDITEAKPLGMFNIKRDLGGSSNTKIQNLAKEIILQQQNQEIQEKPQISEKSSILSPKETLTRGLAKLNETHEQATNLLAAAEKNIPSFLPYQNRYGALMPMVNPELGNMRDYAASLRKDITEMKDIINNLDKPISKMSEKIKEKESNKLEKKLAEVTQKMNEVLDDIEGFGEEIVDFRREKDVPDDYIL